ncbi:MAG: phosphopantothenoylcysteine decarboxylase/phosphopantothenate--cysteine ligase [Chitinophagaceae bacterium]|nr:phosphopantothenoylcysteine decarboxylase/phosphopantothenate--cysteine ligase [Chitinophagaceae bacterium]
MLQGKKVLLGVCGSIAAYKAANLIRLLTKSGAEVRVIMTTSASGFITPLTLSTLSNYPVSTDFLLDKESGQWNSHVEMGLWADLMVIAPASANSIAKAATGVCDNYLQAVYMSARCPVWWAPAMDLDMWQHPSTKANIQKLQSYGNTILDPGTGPLASGLEGKGRMMEPEQIVEALEKYFHSQQRLKGKKIVITAGPTYEPIDPVRFIGNRSSGKMGYAIAEELAKEGAEVYLISGPSHITTIHPGIILHRVESAAQMKDKVLAFFDQSDAAIFSAAVADYTPTQVADQKIKKKEDRFDIALVKTTDIAAACGAIKRTGQFLVGFALETQNEEDNALKKMAVKKQDMIVLNSLRDPGAGFSGDTNKIIIYTAAGQKEEYELKSKLEVAKDIVNKMCLEWLKK